MVQANDGNEDAAGQPWSTADDGSSQTAVISRILREFVLPRRALVARSLVVMLFLAATTGALPFLLKTAADEIFVAKNATMLYAIPLVVMVVMALRSVAEYTVRVTEAKISAGIVADLRHRLFRSLATADLEFLQATHSARFVSVFSADTAAMNRAAAQTVTAIVKNVLQAVALIGAMLWLDPILGGLVLLSLPVSIVLLQKQRGKVRRSIRRQLDSQGDISLHVAQMLSGIRVVKAYDQEAEEAERARVAIDGNRDAMIAGARASARTGPLTEGLSGVGFALAIFYGGWMGISGRLTLGDFMGFMAAAMLIYQPLKSLAGLQNVLYEGTIAARRVFAILDTRARIVDRPGARPLSVAGGAIRFEAVGFSYRPGVPVVEDFTLDVPAGAKVALVGASGAGKSTILNLVLRFYDPSSGRVLIDGQDVAGATLGSVRRASALLTQDPVLFDDTIRANIAYGSPEADDDAVEAAARAADAHEFILDLPGGYATRVGEAGGNLSGGQKQRIAIARAMLRDAPILLLDEPTSALDANAESRVQAALDHLFANRTVLMIAHRLSTVKRADMIVVMDRGRIVETGTHDQLILKDGLYARLHRAQLSGAPAERAPA